MMIKNKILFRGSSLNILIPLNLLHALPTKNIAEGKKNQMSWPDPLVGLIHLAKGWWNLSTQY